MIVQIHLTIFFCFILSLTAAQQPERIDTDRPDQTESAITVPKKYFQFEFGFGKENFKETGYNIIHPGFLIKYGLGKRMELRLEGNFLSEYIHLIPETMYNTILEPIELGTKIALIEEKGIRPKTTVLVHLGLPFAASNYDPNQNIFPSFRFSMQHTLNQNMGLGYNVGAAWDGYDGKPLWLYTLSPNFSFGKKWYSYIEVFGFLKNNKAAQHNLDGGFAYYTSNNTKIDFSGGIGLESNPLRNYIAIGFSFRIPVQKTNQSLEY